MIRRTIDLLIGTVRIERGQALLLHDSRDVDPTMIHPGLRALAAPAA